MENKLFTVEQLEMEIGLCWTSQELAREKGLIGFYKIDGEILYSEEHIRDFLRFCEFKPRSDRSKLFDTFGGELSHILYPWRCGINDLPKSDNSDSEMQAF